MNLTGSHLYSKAVTSLRRPNKQNLHFKLIYIYPIIMDNRMDKYKNIIRDFISGTFIKEILVSNALQLVSMTSEYETPRDIVSPDDNHGMIGNISLNPAITQQHSNPSAMTQIVRMDALKIARYDIQERINAKFNVIKDYFKTDPLYAPLNPKMDFVTLENMVDVPVIVGTKSNSIDHIHLLYVLLGAVGNNIPLDTIEGLNRIISIIRSLQDDKLYKILSNLHNASPTDFGVMSKKDNATPVEPFSQNTFAKSATFKMLKTRKDQIDDVFKFFKFVLDKKILDNMFGIDASNTMSDTILKVRPQVDRLFNTAFDNFYKYFSGPILNLLYTTHNVFYVNGSNLDFGKLKAQYFDNEMMNWLSDINKNQLIDALLNNLEGANPEASDIVIKKLKHLCQISLRDIDTEAKKISDLIATNSLTNIGYSIDQQGANNNKSLNSVIFNLDDMTNRLTSVNNRIQGILNDTLLQSSTSVIFNNLDSKISESVNKFMEEYNSAVNNNYNDVILGNKLFAEGEFLNASRYKLYRESFSSFIIHSIKFFFLYGLSGAICRYTNVVDVEVEAKKADVTEFPNYTLVVGIDIVHLLYAILMYKNWTKLMNDPAQENRTLNQTEQYVKDIIKYVSNELGVPNFFVIDEKKGDVYYKMMHTTGINKTKLTTITTFTQLTNQKYG